MENGAHLSTTDNLDNPVIYRFAIVGGGLTATSMVCQLVDKLKGLRGGDRNRAKDLSIDVFEKQDVLGPGLPHNGRYVLPFHITNMCAKDMTVRITRPEDFQSWVMDNRLSLAEPFPELSGILGETGDEDVQCRHFPRAIMGEYLKSQIEHAARTAQEMGLKLTLHTSSEVIDLAERGGHMYLTRRDTADGHNRVGPFDGVLLATGHWAEASGHKNFFPSPWPAAELLRKIPSGSQVGVLGSSLSAIEVALTLASDGQFNRLPGGELTYVPSDAPRKLTLYSRRGFLPRVRGRIGSRPNRYLTCERLRKVIESHPHQLQLPAIFELLDQELAKAYGRPIDWHKVVKPAQWPETLLEGDLARALIGDGPDGELIWQTALVQIFPVVRELYLHLEPAERERFDRDFSTLFFLHAATQPTINGEKLLALIKAGIVEVVRLGSDYRLAAKTATKEFEIAYQGPGGRICHDTFTYCVDARGQSRSVVSDSSELTQNLLRKEMVTLEHMSTSGSGKSDLQNLYTTGSVLVDPETHRLVRPNKSTTTADSLDQGEIDLFAVGAMTRGQIIDSSMAYGLARSTATIADLLIAGLNQ